MVDEGIRLASPNQGLFRIATRDTEIRGVPIPKGARVWVMFGSANRDESVFPEPDRFDPDRPNLNEHLAFGRGAHFCIGAPLARLELRVVFEQLARRLERMQIPDDFELVYEPSFILRGLESLDVELVKRS
jgi:cytochrome P450